MISWTFLFEENNQFMAKTDFFFLPLPTTHPEGPQTPPTRAFWLHADDSLVLHSSLYPTESIPIGAQYVNLPK
jgi:hypothetical protein